MPIFGRRARPEPTKGRGSGGVMSEIGRLLAALDARIDAFTSRGDPSQILDEAALAEAARLWQAALSTPPSDLTSRKFVVLTLAHLHWYRYLALPAGEDQDDFQKTIRLFAMLFKVDPTLVPEQFRSLLPNDASSTDDPDEWVRQAAAVLERVAVVDDPTALDDAINLLNRALAATPADHPSRLTILTNLGAALCIRFERIGVSADLDQAIHVLRDALAAIPPDHPSRAATLF